VTSSTKNAFKLRKTETRIVPEFASGMFSRFFDSATMNDRVALPASSTVALRS